MSILIKMKPFPAAFLFALLAVVLSLSLKETAVQAETTSYHLEASTYLGRSEFERAQGVYVDADGYIYLTGQVDSNNFPVTPGAFDTSHNGGPDLFVTKLTPDAKKMVWSTYLGGSDQDRGYQVYVDDDGYVYVVGFTESTNFPTTPGAYQRLNGGYADIFVSKLSPDGSNLIFSTLIGGPAHDGTRGPMIWDASGNLIISGTVWDRGNTGNPTFPITPGVLQPSWGGGTHDGVIFKLSADGSSLLFSTFLGGADVDALSSSIAIHPVDQSIIVGGWTSSPNFPVTPGAYQTTYGGGTGDAVIARLSPDATNLVYATFIGGNGHDNLSHNDGMEVDSAGRPIVIIDTTSLDFPTTSNAFQRTHSGGAQYGYDGAVVKLSEDGSSLLAATYIGGSGDEETSGIDVDADGVVYFSGNTSSSNFPVTPDAFQATDGGGIAHMWFTALSPDLSSLVYSTYVSGSYGDRGRSLVLNSSGNIFIAGDSYDADFPITPGAYQETYYGKGDAIVVEFAPGTPAPIPTPSQTPLPCNDTSVYCIFLPLQISS